MNNSKKQLNYNQICTSIIISVYSYFKGVSLSRHQRNVKDDFEKATGGGNIGDTCIPATALNKDSCNIITYCNTDALLQPECKLQWWFILIVVVVGVIIIGSVLGCILKALGCCCC